MNFEIYKGEDDKNYFRLRGDNGDIIVKSEGHYTVEKLRSELLSSMTIQGSNEILGSVGSLDETLAEITGYAKKKQKRLPKLRCKDIAVSKNENNQWLLIGPNEDTIAISVTFDSESKSQEMRNSVEEFLETLTLLGLL